LLKPPMAARQIAVHGMGTDLRLAVPVLIRWLLMI